MKRQSLKNFWFFLPICLSLLICTILSSCSNYEERLEEVQSGISPLNILLISLDTVRADHLSCYGYKYNTSPNIDNLAKNGTLFKNCQVSVPLTLPSHTNLLSGLYPFKNDVRVNDQLVPDTYPTLAEILKNNRYSTSAFIGAFILDSRFGLDRGFDLYDDDMSQGITLPIENPKERRAEVVNSAFLKWLDENPQEPFFAFVHFFDPHIPYIPPERFKDKFEHPYDAEIAYTDSVVGKLLNALEEMELTENTLIILLSDHGEGLEEHGEPHHGDFIYQQTLHVPLIFHCPGLIPEGRQIEEPVSLSDIVPTILDMLGIAIPDECDGRSLLNALIYNKKLPQQPIYSESLEVNHLYGWSPLYAITYQGWKYIHAPFPELYNLKEDPGELDNLYHVNRKKAHELAEMLISINEEASDLTRQLVTPPLDPETVQNLQSLGYISAGGFSPGTGGELIDPKDRVEVLRLLSEQTGLLNLGDQAAAFEHLQKILELDPNIAMVYSMLIPFYMQQGDLDKAKTCALKAVELEPGNHSNYIYLATTYMLSKEYHQAVEILQNLLDQELPAWDEAKVYMNLALIAGDAHNDLKKKASLLKTAHQLDPKNADILYHLIKALDQSGGEAEEIKEYISQFHQMFPGDPRSERVDAILRRY